MRGSSGTYITIPFPQSSVQFLDMSKNPAETSGDERDCAGDERDCAGDLRDCAEISAEISRYSSVEHSVVNVTAALVSRQRHCSV